MDIVTSLLVLPCWFSVCVAQEIHKCPKFTSGKLNFSSQIDYEENISRFNSCQKLCLNVRNKKTFIKFKLLSNI